MLIALIGGVSFFGYVQFNISVANENERRITELQSVKLPALEALLLLKGDVQNVHNAFSAALVFENQFLLEETFEHANTFLTHINDINWVDKTSVPFTNELTQKFDDYYLASRSVANLLIEHPEQSREYEEDILDVNRKRSALVKDIDKVIDIRKKDYINSLAHINREIVLANNIGSILGALLIIGLVLLAWSISITVVRAVNKSNQLKKVFLDTMSHELRTPINGISGALSLLKATSLSDEQMELVEACKSSEQSICSSIDDILEFSGIVSGKIKVAQLPFTIEPLINNTLQLFQNECEFKGIILKATFESEELKSSTLLGDEQRLCHVLRHLVGNAVKFSQNGIIHIHISSVQDKKFRDRKRITFSIQDNGPGIPDDVIKDVFLPFHQIDGSFSRQHQGIGIGIPMCASLAKAMNGKLSVYNREQGGLEVKFEFNVFSQAKSLDSCSSVTDKNGKSTAINILIVEDNEVNQMVLKTFVKKMGFQSESATNGKEALHLIKQRDFSVILMDCQMPIMDGFDATKEIRRLEKSSKHTPIIAVTANAMEGDRERCLKVGMDDYLKKPVSLDKLKNCINKYLTRE